METRPAGEGRRPPTTFQSIKQITLPPGIDRESIETAGPFNNIAFYVGYGVFLREVVSATYAVAIGFYIAAAAQALQEAQYLGAGVLTNDNGIFDSGLRTYQFFLAASILACISNGVALGLSLMSRVNPVVRLWWPENKNPDLMIQIIYFGLDIGVIILADQAINIYTPDKPDWGSNTVDCSKEAFKYSCAFTNNILWKNVYGRLFFTKDITREYATDSILDYDGPYFNDIASNFALVFGLRAGLTFLVLLWANYKPLYLFGFTRTVCNPLGCGDKEGSRATSEHVECGWSLGGLLSNWSNNQLGALRNHDWVGSLFFFIAFIVLSMGLNDSKISGSYIPRKTVLDDYAKELSTEMKTIFETNYGGDADGVYTPCKASFLPFETGSTLTATAPLASIMMSSNILTKVTNALSASDASASDASASDASASDPTTTTVTIGSSHFTIPEALQLGLKNQNQFDFIGTNAMQCANEKNTNVATTELFYFSSKTSDAADTYPKAKSTVDISAAYNTAYLASENYLAPYCCANAGKDAPTKFEDSISSRFETYAILMMIGSIFWAISALAQFIAMTFYNVRARPLSLVDPDGGYSMTPA